MTAMLLMFGLAFQAQAQVPASARGLIIITELDSTGIPEISGLYRTLEDLTIGIPTLPGIRNSYADIVTLRNGTATMAHLRHQMRRMAARNDIRAIDVILALHGADNKLRFRDEAVTMQNMQTFMNEGTPEVVARTKGKLRLIYNTSCFGASHRAAFRNIGFDVVIGSVGVNANSEVEYPSFLGLWNSNNSVAASMIPSNNPVTLAVTDGPLVATGNFLNNFLKKVNSKKLFSGNTAIRISTPAQ